MYSLLAPGGAREELVDFIQVNNLNRSAPLHAKAARDQMRSVSKEANLLAGLIDYVRRPMPSFMDDASIFMIS